MSASNWESHFSKGVIGSRPAANTLPKGAIYFATDEAKFYVGSGAANTWADFTAAFALASDLTGLATESYADAAAADAVTALIDSAPGALDTLNELAAALGDDASFASTVTTALAGKASLSGATFTGDINVPDEAYDATTWNGSTEVPTKNAVRDKIEALAAGGEANTASNVGGEKEVFKTKSGVDLIFRTLKAGSGVTLTQNTNDIEIASSGAAAANHAYYTYKAAHLEPLAAEAIQSGAFSYAIGSSTKLIVYAWTCRIGASGRLDVRDTASFLPIKSTTLVGTSSGSNPSHACLIDPSLATYTDARTTYLDRLNSLATMTPLYVALTAPGVYYNLLPGPYGAIIVHTTTYDFTWIGPSGDSTNWALPITNEIGDTGSSDYQRVTTQHPIPLTKLWSAGILTGSERTSGAGAGCVMYVNLPSTWGKVTDPNTYIFRDDFMGASLDTATAWTRNQSTAGNVEIETAAGTANWCAVKGNDNWGTNGARSQTTTARSAGKVFLCDVYTGNGSGATTAGAPNLIVGWNTGAGNADSNFAHGVDFSVNAGSRALFVFEGGSSRGAVGSGYSLLTIYRVRITLGASNDATYEIQGGTQYPPIGGSAWQDITPGTTSNSATPLCAGFTQYEDSTTYLSDVRLY